MSNYLFFSLRVFFNPKIKDSWSAALDLNDILAFLGQRKLVSKLGQKYLKNGCLSFVPHQKEEEKKFQKKFVLY